MRKLSENLWLKIASLLVYFFLYAPIIVLVAFSFNDSKLSTVWKGFTWKWYVTAWQNRSIVESVRTSLIVATLSTVIATIIGTLAALAMVRYRSKLISFFSPIFYLPIIIPEIVIGFATVIFFGLFGLKLGLSTVVIAHVAFSLSYVIFVVRARLAGMPSVFEQAAMDLGANELQTFFLVTLPLLAPGIISAALLVFTLSLDDYVITSFVAGSGTTTLPLQIYSMVKTGVTPEVNAVSSILLLVTIALVFVSQQFEKDRPSKLAYISATIAIVALSVFAIGGSTKETNRRQLNLYIWSNYASKQLIEDFEKRYNAKVRVEIFDSNEALLAKLQTGLVDYDIIVPSDYMVTILIKQGLVQPIERERLTNLNNIDPRFLGLPFDPENRYSVPYTWGTSGIGYRKDKIAEIPDSWAVMMDNRYKDRIAMLNDVRENFAFALKLKGYSLNSTSPEEIEAAAKILKEQKPLVRAYDSDAFTELLVSGDVWLVQGYSGQLGKAVLEYSNIGYVIPKEGATIWTDNICIPKTAQDPDLAVTFINYILEAEVAAENSNTTGYPTPNGAARQMIKPEMLNSPASYPPEATLRRCEFLRDLGQTIQLYDLHWTEIKSQ
ncbi:MAG: extracellular solute-binding protein [Blastocatellia bacterium]|nr:extracellular solute-binding protein [Blastocatellia bacterium]